LSLPKSEHAPIALNARCAVRTAAEFAKSAVTGMGLPNWAAVSLTVNTWRGNGKGRKERMKRVPFINFTECSDCETCLELCPAVFVRNKETGFIEIQDLEEYPEEEIYEVMNYCPQECIVFLEDV